MREPIQYTVENKNGVHEYSDSFEINDWVLIRINILHPIKERNFLTSILKRISCQDGDIKFDDSSNDYSGQCSTIHHPCGLHRDVFIKNTKDLKFELIENSKIAVMLLFKKKYVVHSYFPPSDYDYYTPPTPRLLEVDFEQEVKFEKRKKIIFEVERINGVVKFTPEKLDVNKIISLIRTTSSNEKTNNDVPFKHNGVLHETNKYLSAYGFPQYIRDTPVGKLDIKDISEFNFDEIPDNIKLTVELFEHQPINIKRTLKP